MVYISIAKIKQPCLLLLSPLLQFYGAQQDFINAHGLLLEVFFQVFAPGFICCFLHWPIFGGDGLVMEMRLNTALSCLQGLTLAWVIFASRVTPESSQWYMGCAPEFTFALGIFSCFLMPIAIVIIDLIFLISDKHAIGAVQPLIILIVCNQVVALINNFASLLSTLIGDLGYWQQERDGYVTLYRRGIESGDIYKSLSNVNSLPSGQSLLRTRTGVEFDKELEALKKPLPDETEEQKETCKAILKERKKPYADRSRSVFDGPVRLGSPLEVREDFYAFSFIFWLKRQTIQDDGEDSDVADDQQPADDKDVNETTEELKEFEENLDVPPGEASKSP